MATLEQLDVDLFTPPENIEKCQNNFDKLNEVKAETDVSVLPVGVTGLKVENLLIMELSDFNNLTVKEAQTVYFVTNGAAGFGVFVGALQLANVGTPCP